MVERPDWRGDGRVRFVNDAASDFDRFTRSPHQARQRWMRRHYYRQRVYSPYFDRRSTFYRRGWVYRDLYAVYRRSGLARQRPDWILRDRAGRRLYIPFDCAGGVCPQYAGDVGSSAFRAHWIQKARRALARGRYRGLHVDDVNMELRVSDGRGRAVVPIDPRTGREMTRESWRRYVAEFTERIRAAFPRHEIVHNPIWFSADDEFSDRANSAADWINLERGVNDHGLHAGGGTYGFETFLEHVDRLHAAGASVVFDSYARDRVAAEYNLATYLLVNRGRDATGSRYRRTPANWWSAAYDLDLGASLGPRYEWSGLLRRDFELGYVLVNQPGRGEVTVPTPDSRGLEGNPTPSTTLAGGQGVVRITR